MGKIRRLQDWPTRLEAAIDAARKCPFEWGKNDCALFAADCVLAMTGVDFAASFRGKYKTAEGAKRKLKAAGTTGLSGYVGKLFGDSVEPVFATRGDLACVKSPEGTALGIVDNTGRRVACVGKDGLIFEPLSQALKIWKI